MNESITSVDIQKHRIHYYIEREFEWLILGVELGILFTVLIVL